MKLKQVLLNILLGTILLMVGCNSAEQKSESEADTSESVKESVVVETEIESTEWESETEESIKTVEIQCYVIDVDDEHSLTEVKVTAVDGDEKEYEVKTDEGGWFELLLPEGTYTLTFEKENYEREELYDIVVESGKDVDIPDRIKLKS
ncbi:MAG: carboxypeptidase regulatory-like domain-containing protein, partial [Lachnospiraceae bacterium]|nr:carboxypeptidase regulatory-like domain-containing protein [Lachnospiraceae bacterium]